MTEPLAYMWKTAGGNVLGFQEYKEDIPYQGYVTPLYTAEQLQNKIELTKDEFELLAKVCRGIQPFKKIEQNIKVLPDMKWFVKLRKETKEFNMLYIDEGGFHYNQNKRYATYFDTKEEAELWTNPLTEAVQLPVKGE